MLPPVLPAYNNGVPANTESVQSSNSSLEMSQHQSKKATASRAIRRMSFTAIRRLSEFAKPSDLEQLVVLTEEPETNEEDPTSKPAQEDEAKQQNIDEVPVELVTGPGLGSLPAHAVEEARPKTPDLDRQTTNSETTSSNAKKVYSSSSNILSSSNSNSNSNSKSKSNSNSNSGGKASTHMAPSVADTSIKRIKGSAARLASSRKRGAAISYETEEQRQRRLLLTELTQLLKVFDGDKDILHAIVEAAVAVESCVNSSQPSLHWKSNHLLVKEKASKEDLISKPAQMLQMILDLGFELITSDPETLFNPNSPVSIMTLDVEAGRQPLYFGLQPLGTIPSLTE
ncbi:hypothetical protein HDV05_007609, partial [Chytridiales sp. JEL 0842]